MSIPSATQANRYFSHKPGVRNNSGPAAGGIQNRQQTQFTTKVNYASHAPHVRFIKDQPIYNKYQQALVDKLHGDALNFLYKGDVNSYMYCIIKSMPGNSPYLK